MKKFKFFIISVFVIIMFSFNNTSATIKKLTFGDNKISNYFLGVVLLNENKPEAALKHFDDDVESNEDETPKFAVIGRPNVGKSSFMN